MIISLVVLGDFWGIFNLGIRIQIHSESRVRFTWLIEYNCDFAHLNDFLSRCCLFAAVVAINIFLKSFIFVSSHRRRHVASDMGFNQDSPNPGSLFY